MEKFTVKMVDVNTKKTVAFITVSVETSHNGYPLPEAIIDRDAVNTAIVKNFGENAFFSVDTFRTNGGSRIFGHVMRLRPYHRQSAISISDLVYVDVCSDE